MNRFNEILSEVAQAASERFNKKISKSYIGDNLDDDLMTPTETNYYELDRVNLANLKAGDMVKNINKDCKHYGSEGYVDDVSELPDYMGQVVRYTTINAGPTWSIGEKLVKTPNQLMLMRNIGINEYKEEFLGMSISSIKAIFAHAQNILAALEDNQKKDTVSENLTESWLQGKIAVTEENMRSVHDFVMFSEEETDTDDSGATVEPVDPKKKQKKLTIKDLPTSRFYFRKDPLPDVQDPQNKDMDDDNTPYMDDFSGVWAKKQPGLWENIRKKKEREGKSYKPSKMGEKDRPSPEQWKKLTKKKDNS